MNFDKKKIVICFFVILIFFNNLGFKNVKANPAVIPIAGQAFVEFLVTVAGCLGIQYLTYPDAEDFTNDILNSASAEDLENLGIEKDDDGKYYLNEDKTLEIEFTENGVSVPTDWLKEYTLFFNSTLGDMISSSGVSVKYDYSSDVDLISVLKEYNITSLDSLNDNAKYFKNEDGDKIEIDSLSYFLNDDFFVILHYSDTEYWYSVVSCYDKSLNLFLKNDSKYYSIDSNGAYYFVYNLKNAVAQWSRRGFKFKENVANFIDNKILYTNKPLIDVDGSVIAPGGQKIGSIVDGDGVVADLASENIVDLPVDDVVNIIDSKEADRVVIPDIDVSNVGAITYDPIFDKPIDERLVVDIPIDVPVDDIFGGEEIEDDVYNDSNIFDWFTNFWDNLLKFVKSLFIVDDLYFVEKIDYYKQKLTDILNLDFSFFDTFNNLSDDDFKDIRININGNNVVIVDFSNLNKFRGYFKALISGVVEIFFWFFNYRQLVWLIRKSTVFSGSSERNEKR